MTNAKTTPHWYLSNETRQELKEAIKKDFSNLDLGLAKDAIELKSLLFIARLFQRSSIRTEILKRSTNVSDFLSQMIPCTFRSCGIHVTGYENLLEESTEDRDRYRNSTAVDSEKAYLLDIVEESVEINFKNELLPNEVGHVLCEYFHLSDVEKSITECISYLSASEHFENIIDTDLIRNFSDTCQILSIGLNTPLKNINQALATSAPLAKFGLIEVDSAYHFTDVLKLQTSQRIFDYFYKGSLDKEELDT